MKWLVVMLLLLAAVLLAAGRWTRVSGHSADERAGSDLAYLLAMLAIALAVMLLVAWAVVNLFF